MKFQLACILFKPTRTLIAKAIVREKNKSYTAVWALNVKMTDPLVVAAELSERNYPGKCSREVWGPSETHVPKNESHKL